MPNPFARNFLAIAALVFAATGATFLVAPSLVPAIATNPNATADALNDVRAIYGAMELAIGVFLGLCARRPQLYEAGCLAALVVGSIAALSRFAGFALVAGTPVQHLAYGALDLVGAGVAAIALRRLARG